MQILSLIPECTILLSSKEEGSIQNLEDADRLARSVSNLSKIPVILPLHEHATRTWVVTSENTTQIEFPADILLTKEKQVALAHQFADCVPLLFVDRKRKAIGFAHAGWRGLTMGGVQITILSMQANFGSHPEDLWVWIGPCIQKESYVFEEKPIQSALESWSSSIETQKGNYAIDLPHFIESSCVQLGIDPTRIINDGRDTYQEREIFFSHRRAKETRSSKDKGNFSVLCWIN